MAVGCSHQWDYPNGVWEETKIDADRWQFKFSAIKGRKVAAPENSGAPINTGYHWFIIADQRVIKINKDEYQTIMEGSKFKMGHRSPLLEKMELRIPRTIDIPAEAHPDTRRDATEAPGRRVDRERHHTCVSRTYVNWNHKLRLGI